MASCKQNTPRKRKLYLEVVNSNSVQVSLVSACSLSSDSQEEAMGCPWGQESTSEMASEDEIQLIISCLKCLRSGVVYVSEHLLIGKSWRWNPSPDRKYIYIFKYTSDGHLMCLFSGFISSYFIISRCTLL